MASKSKDKGLSGQDLYKKFLDFLKSPVWGLPIMSFIEQRSIIFDSDQSAASVKEYKQAHLEFSNLVDILIKCFCEDMKVHPAALIEAVQKEKGTQKSNIELGILEPVVAANEYEVFVHMMARKNVELQLQALQMIEFMCGLIPAVLVPVEGANKNAADSKGKKKKTDGKTGVEGATDSMVAMRLSDEPPEEQEHRILMEVMKQSKDEWEREQENRSVAQKDLQEQMKESLAAKDHLEAERDRHGALVEKAMRQSMQDGMVVGDTSLGDSTSKPGGAAVEIAGDTSIEASKKAPAKREGSAARKRPGSAKRPGTATKKTETKKKTAAEVRSLMHATDDGPTDAAVRARQDYLKQQRDKLLQMKKAAREQAFAQAETASSSLERPKTAKAARNALRGGGQAGGGRDRGRAGAAGGPAITDDVLAARRAVAAQLKQEVLGGRAA